MLVFKADIQHHKQPTSRYKDINSVNKQVGSSADRNGINTSRRESYLEIIPTKTLESKHNLVVGRKSS